MFRRVRSSDIIAAARFYLGVPFRHQGRSARGLDCLGLLAVSLRDAGCKVSDRADYGRAPNVAEMKAGLDSRLIRVPKTHIRTPGVIALFHDEAWLHVGIITGRGFIHSRGPEGLGAGVVEHILDKQSWAPRLMRLWRHPDMEWEG